LNRIWIAFGFSLLFAVIGFLILYDQYLMIKIWFQIEDFHHETLALSFFALALGVLIGAITQNKQRERED
jgi:hypothetical protein